MKQSTLPKIKLKDYNSLQEICDKLMDHFKFGMPIAGQTLKLGFELVGTIHQGDHYLNDIVEFYDKSYILSHMEYMLSREEKPVRYCLMFLDPIL